MAAAANKTFNISVVVNLKRGKDEIEYAKSETDKLFNLISNSVEIEWAKGRVERIHEMVFMPSSEQIKNEIVEKLKEADDDTQG